MFLKEYGKCNLSYDDVQFLIALALDSLDLVSAAKSVLFFMSPKGKNQFLDNVPNNRESLRAYLSSKSGNLIMNTIDFYYENDMFLCDKKADEIYGNNQYVNLRRLTKTVTKSQLYEKCMQLAFNYTRKQFICLYIHSKMFYKELFNFLNKFTRSKVGTFGSQIDDTVVTEVANGLAYYVERYSDGVYVASSCNPDAFLFPASQADNSQKGPLWFYIKQDAPKGERENEFFSILNRHGINISLGNEDVTIADKESLDIDSTEKTIDFIEVCTRIQKASMFLFYHSNLNEAYMDIFTYHRETLLNSRKQALKKTKTVGYTYDILADRGLIDESVYSFVQNKYNTRKKLCGVFEKVLYDEISTQDINDLYNKVINTMVIECSNSSGTKDAKSPFSLPGYKSQSPGGTNGNRFQILLQGYLALKELLAYIESNSNVLGISVNQFPVDIFRNEDFLKRFSSMEEYISYIDDLRPLYYEVKTDGDRNKVILNNLYSNDYVYELLSGERVLIDNNLLKISAAPLNFIKTTVEMFNSQSPSNALKSDALKASMHWNTSRNTMFKADFFNLAEKDPQKRQQKKESAQVAIEILNYNKLTACTYDTTVLSLYLAKQILAFANKPLKELRGSTYVYFLLSAYANVLRADLAKDPKTAIDTVAGKYNLIGKTFMEIAALPLSIRDVNVKFWGENSILRAKALAVSTWILWGTEKEKDKFLDIKGPWENAWYYWNVMLLMTRYLACCNEKMSTLGGMTEDISRMSIYATSFLDFLKIPNVITNTDSLSTIKAHEDPTLAISRLSVENHEDIVQYKKTVLKVSFTILFKTMGYEFKFYSNLYQRAMNDFGMLKVAKVSASTVNKLLSEQVPLLESRYLTGEIDLAFTQKLSVNAQFDKEGYALRNSERYVYNKNIYIHKTGWAVKVSPEVDIAEIVPITTDMLQGLILKF